MLLRVLFFLTVLTLFPVVGSAQEAPPAAAPSGPDLATQAVAAQAMQDQRPVEPRDDLIEHLVDSVLAQFDVEVSGNTTIHYVLAVLFFVFGIALRRLLIGIVFAILRKLAARTKTTLDDKLLPQLEAPCATLIVVTGFFAALRVLKLSPELDEAIGHGSTVAFSLVIFWLLLRAFSGLLDHAYELAIAKQLGIAAFMPWIKRTLIATFAVVGVLMVVQSIGYDVKALLAGLGIGGLAFALAAQDTLANLFGAVVVAIDQPFKLGDYVKIGAFEGTVEDIGLRSTKLRNLAKNLIILPNKMVAAEAITNNSRFTQRRVEQVIGLTYSTTPEKMTAIVAKIRALIEAEPAVDSTSVHVYFRDFNASSLDIWVVYSSRSPDFPAGMVLRQKINLAIMAAVAEAGLDFAFPSQTIHLDGDIARRLVEPRPKPPAQDLPETTTAPESN